MRYTIRYHGAPYGAGESGHEVTSTESPAALRTAWERLGALAQRDHAMVGVEDDGSTTPLLWDAPRVADGPGFALRAVDGAHVAHVFRP